MNSIHIIDYDMGNLGSIKNMLKYLGFQSEITSDPDNINNADKIILPGVGAFDNGMNKISKLGLKPVLDQKALFEKIPILGICLGMQLMTNKSEEGKLKGLGWIDADTVKFSFNDQKLRIPHMGWNQVRIKNNIPLINELNNESRFYFVHSYYVKCKENENIVCTTNYGIEFDSLIFNENIFGCQFHPEKSHKFGMKIFQNFAEL
jgi:glutamine amidotransferase